MQIAQFFATQCVRFLQAFAVAWVVVYLVDRTCRLRFASRLRRVGCSWLGLVAIGCLSAVVAAWISWMRPPLPSVHDEFSYLLAADTFSHGRLTNPTPPLWPHFETLHVIQQPTYASKYPPGQGLVLAMGQIAAGDPMAGLWLSAGLAAAAATWMLRGWMPPRWALLGGMLVALHPGIQLIWTQSYWGGNVAFIGGALVLGAYARLRRAARCRDAVWMGVGLGILANSRPFEGAVASLPVAVAMLFWCHMVVAKRRQRVALGVSPRTARAKAGIAAKRRQHSVVHRFAVAASRLWDSSTRILGLTPKAICLRHDVAGRWPSAIGPAFRSTLLFRVCLPLLAALAVAAAWMAYYNWRVTGNPAKMPYMVHEQTYGAAPFFLWQPAGPVPEYRHEKIARLHGWLRDTYLYQRTWAGFVGEKWIALVNLWHFFLGIGLSIPLLALPWVLRNRRYWLPVAIVSAGWIALVMTTWANPHYFAPAAPALLLLVVQGIRHLRVRATAAEPAAAAPSPPGRGMGKGAQDRNVGSATARTSQRASRRRLAVRALVLAQLIGFVQYAWFHVRQPDGEFAGRRADFVRQLQADPGQHLVVVQYGSEYDIHQEWVHNGADIDSARIIWARSMGDAADRRLVEYFQDRHVWLLRADETTPQLVPYGEATQPGS